MKTYKDIKLHHGDTCQFCHKQQVSSNDDDGYSGICDWCAYDDFNDRQFQAELSKDDPNFDDFYSIGDRYI